MSALLELSDKLEAFKNILRTKPQKPIPESALQRTTAGLEKLIEALKPYFAPEKPTNKDLKAAKEHPLAAQIVSFIGMDKDRKKFFDLPYFKQKFEALPADKDVILPFIKTEKAPAYLGALLLYHYWAGRPKSEALLQKLWQDIQSDFRSNPAARKKADAMAFLKTLFAEKQVAAVVDALQSRYPTETDLREFAKDANLKVPAPGKGRKVPPKTLHERLGEAIHKQSGIVRMELE